MQVSSGEMKQKRLLTMQKGVSAAAQLIERQMHEEFGEPVYKTNRLARDPFAFDSPYRVALVTLTYSPEVEWSAKHISALIKNYREWFRKRGHKFRFVWTIEMQGNGKPHYHVVCWFPGRLKPPMPDAQGWWPHGMTNAIWARSPVGYIVKYASKMESKSGQHLPKGCRLWAYGGVPMSERGFVAFATAPKWLKEIVRHDSHPRKKLVETSVWRTLRGELIEFKRRVMAWCVTKGEAVGWAYLSPYRFSDLVNGSLVLDHLGVIECICPQGDSHFIAHARG